ncbi:hypothetical protein OAG24_01115 [bacterium]|nr:hypothetical protein [bacterium]
MTISDYVEKYIDQIGGYIFANTDQDDIDYLKSNFPNHKIITDDSSEFITATQARNWILKIKSAEQGLSSGTIKKIQNKSLESLQDYFFIICENPPTVIKGEDSRDIMSVRQARTLFVKNIIEGNKKDGHKKFFQDIADTMYRIDFVKDDIQIIDDNY